MKKKVLFPAILTVCSVITAIVYHNPFVYFNLFLSIVLLCIVLFSRNMEVANRMKFSALWLIMLELLAFVLLLFGENIYQPPAIWVMYAVFVALDLCVTPQIEKRR